MTRAKLEEYICLVDRLREALAAYEAFASLARPGAQIYDGMPHISNGISRKTESLGISLAKYEEILGLRRLERAVAALKPEIEEYIASVQDVKTQTVLTLHVLNALPFKAVAVMCGRGTSEDAVKMRYNRAIKELPE